MLSGCDLRSHLDVTQPRSSADAPAVAEAASLIASVIDQIAATTARHPGSASGLAGVLSMHRAHLAVLRKAAGPTPSPAAGAAPRVPVGQKAALQALLFVERSARGRLTSLAQHARSGELARVLASMAAAVSQRLEEWPT